MFHGFGSGHTSQSAIVGLLLEVWFEAEELAVIAFPLNSARPVMAQANVHLRLNEKELARVQLSHVVYALNVAPIVRETFVVGLLVVEAFPDTREPGNTYWTKVYDVGCSHVVDVGSCPASVVQLPHVVAGLVVAAYEDGQVWCGPCTRVVLMKVLHTVKLLWHRDSFQVISIAHRLMLLVVPNKSFEVVIT